MRVDLREARPLVVHPARPEEPLAEGEPRGPWRRANIALRNRQLPDFTLRVQVVRLGVVDASLAHMTPSVTPFSAAGGSRREDEDHRTMRSSLTRWLGEDLGQLSGRVSDEVGDDAQRGKG